MRALLLLLAALHTAPLLAIDVLAGLREDGAGFAQVVPGKELKFPADHAAHPDYRIEWWYLTANLLDREGRQWGLQWTLFRQALSAEQAKSGWQSNQVWMAHAAITTPQGHFHEQRFSRGGIGQAGVIQLDGEEVFNAWIDDWQWRSNTASILPAKLKFDVDGHEVNLLLEATGEPVANGIDGYSQKSQQGQASYYYSLPHIRVRGFVSKGRDKQYLSGNGWLDREWSSQPLATNQSGWDWFSLHLNDGNKLMIYQLRHDDGQHWLSGNWIDATGKSRTLDADAVTLQSTGHRMVKTGTAQQRDLPLDWSITLNADNRRLRVKPLYDDQWMDTSVPYWEGVVLVEDELGKPAGVGYMELTGYE